jgi:hypothetical protein
MKASEKFKELIKDLSIVFVCSVVGAFLFNIFDIDSWGWSVFKIGMIGLLVIGCLGFVVAFFIFIVKKLIR